MLSGKYLDGKWPEKARLTLFERFVRYTNGSGLDATRAYVELAKQNKMTPVEMALAYVNTRSFVTSNIVGATTMAQLRENLGSLNVTLSPDVLEAIETIHQEFTYPCP